MIKNISVIIPTYKREQVLLDTLASLIKQIEPGDEILVMDQAQAHEPKIGAQLEAWNKSGTIRWIRLKEPSITGAMNHGALAVKNELLLFLDDDIIPDAGLLKGHRQAYREPDTWAVVGGITQPGQADDTRLTTEVMAGNLSVIKSRFLDVGRFDENFVGAAYRFEKEFGERLVEHGGKIVFEPLAGIRHLQAGTGGVRFAGKHTSTILPYHSVGEYYYYFRSSKVKHKLSNSLRRLFSSVCTKHHLLKPWWIPITLVAEISGFFWGLFLFLQGPRLLKSGKTKLAVFSPYPIQYYSPWFRKLAQQEGFDFRVYYGFIPSDEQQGYGFGAAFKWDVPLLDGYKWEAVPNARKNPGFNSFFASSTPEIRKVFAKDRPDAVVLIGWSFLPLVQALWACRKLRIPAIVRGDSNNLNRRNFIVKMLHYYLLSKYDAFLAVGKLNKQFYMDYGIPEEKIFWARHFVDNAFFEAKFNELKDSRPALRAGWNIPQDAVCFLFAGKLEEKKRIMDLLGALEIAVRENRAIHLLVAGDGEFMQEAKSFATGKKLPVTFAGFLNQTEIVKAYAAADCLVLPSDYGETWGLAVNEAMACGLPAIVSDRVGCGPDLVADGVTGYIFPFGEINALAGKLLECALDKTKLAQMGKQARDLIADYSVENAVKGTLEAVKYALKA